MRTSVLVLGIVMVVLGLAAGGIGVVVSSADVATYNSRCTGFFPPADCPSIAAEANTYSAIALVGGILFIVGLVLAIVGAILRPEGETTPQVIVQPIYPPPPVYAPQGSAYPPAVSPSMAAAAPRAKEMFCPNCGAHYPAGTQFCSKDATALKEAQ